MSDFATLSLCLRTTPLGWGMLFFIGSVLGSFINVLIHRVPREISIWRPPSHCPACGRRVRPHENIPILAYVFLRGRCRGCGVRISLRYPLVEALGGGLTVASVLLAPTLGAGAIWTLFSLALLAVLFIDLDFRIIPDPISLPGIVAGLVWSFFNSLGILDALLGVLAGGGGLLLIAVVYQKVTGREGLGMGDVKLMAMVGAFLGWQGALGTLLVGSLAGSLVGATLILRGKGTGQTALPFGTFLAPAAWAILFMGERLWSRYLLFFTSP